MSLSSLFKNTSVQEEAINELSLLVSSTTRWSTYWGDFRDSVWGRGLKSFQKEEPVERDDVDPVDHVELPTTHPVVTLPATLPNVWKLHSRQILVRSEYNEAERTAVLSSESDKDVFVVTGQPGIGKSVFLLWLLMRRLALRLPTALHIRGTYALLFHEGGVSELTQLDGNPEYNALYPPPDQISRKIWVLIDSNPALPEPAAIFKCPSPFFVVGAVSPRSGCLGWLKKAKAQYFYMNLWSAKEVLQSRPFLGTGRYTERQLLHLHDVFGASPRALAHYADEPARYEVHVRRKIDELAPGHLQRVFHDPRSHDCSHTIVAIEPSATDRGLPQKTITSRRIFELLWEKHMKHRVEDIKYFNNLFEASTSTSNAAGWVFEFRMHQLLRRRQTVRFFPISGHRTGGNFTYSDYTASEQQTSPMVLRLTGSAEYRLVERGRVEENCYYRPEPTNFPTIHSMLLTQHPGEPPPPPKSSLIFLLFQMTRNKSEHIVNERGLDIIKQMKLPSNVDQYYVVVTPEHTRPKITVPANRFGNEEPNDAFPVYHYPVPMEDLFPTKPCGS